MVRKKTALREAYIKERRRIQNQIRRMEKRGYYFKKTVLPEIPKRITSASLSRLQKITTDTLYRESRYVIDIETGETTSGVRGRDIERSASARRAAETRRQKEAFSFNQMSIEIVNNYLSWCMEEARNKPNPQGLYFIARFIRQLTVARGYPAVASMLIKAQQAGVEIYSKSLYRQGIAEAFIQELTTYLSGGNGYEIEIMDEYGYEVEDEI